MIDGLLEVVVSDLFDKGKTSAKKEGKRRGERGKGREEREERVVSETNLEGVESFGSRESHSYDGLDVGAEKGKQVKRESASHFLHVEIEGRKGRKARLTCHPAPRPSFSEEAQVS